MTSAYQQQLAQQLHAAEDELGRLRRHIAKLTEERDTAHAELATLHQGEAPYDDERLAPTPGQWIWKWNQLTPAERLDTAARILDSGDRSYACFMGNHPAQIDGLKRRAEQAEAERDGAYRERAHLTAWLATIHPAVITAATDIDEPGWQILYLTVGGRQLSWHIHPRDADLYAHVEHVPTDDLRAQWDGHTTEQKYQAIRSLTFAELRGHSPIAITVKPGVARTPWGVIVPKPEPHTCYVREDEGEWNVRCDTCNAYIDNIGSKSDAEEWVEDHEAAARKPKRG